MVDLYRLGLLASVVSGVSLGVVGIVLLLVRPQRNYTVAFGAFLLLWAGWIVAGNLSGLAAARGDTGVAEGWILVYFGLYAVSYIPIGYFGAIYPHRHGIIARRPLAAALFLTPSVVGVLAFLLVPETAFRGFTGEGIVSSTWGPVFLLAFAALNGSIYYALWALTQAATRAGSRIEAQRVLLVLGALLVYVSHWSAWASSTQAPALVRALGSGASALNPSVFTFMGLAGLGILAWIWSRVGRMTAPDRADRRLLAAAILVPGAFGAFEGSLAAFGVLDGALRSLGLWRTLSAVLVAYAVLRYELFDIEIKIKRGVVWSGFLVLLALGTLGVEQVLERWVSSGLAVTTSALAFVVAVGFVALRSPGAASFVASRLLPALDSPTRLDARRLEVYEAALANVVAEGKPEEAEGFLADLRGRLAVSEAEHALLLRVVGMGRQATSKPLAGLLGPGSEIAGRYRLGRVLGEGTFGTAFLSEDTALGRAVVVKTSHAKRASDEASMRRFLAEARAAASVEHPNVVRVYDFGYQGDTPYLVMEHAEGGSLLARLESGAPLPPAEVASIMDGVLAGLASVHASGLLHRDLKPGNVLLGRDGTPKIADFGLAVPVDAQATAMGLAVPPIPAGTPAYTSPESLKGLPLTEASDLYSAGALLYHLLAGETYVRFDGLDAFGIRRVVLQETPRPLPREVEPAFGTLVRRALAKEPEERFGSAEEMRAALRVASAGRLGPASRREAPA